MSANITKTFQHIYDNPSKLLYNIYYKAFGTHLAYFLKYLINSSLGRVLFNKK